MFFEGSEKKVEIIVDSDSVSLLNDFTDEYWKKVAAKCDAKVISIISNEKAKAFLLSESSLFVWDDRLLILTCGDTLLVKSAIYFLDSIESNSVLQVIYQRKNEYCSHLQKTHVLDDAKILYEYCNGKLLRFGDLDSHHTYLYHLDNDFVSKRNDKTYEVLIYNISPLLSSALTQADVSKNTIRSILKLDKIIPDFKLDDFVFEPFGYSLNAIRGSDYFTIHLTPQEQNSYISFESNLDLIKFIPIILKSFKPASFDIVTYNEFNFKEKVSQLIPYQYKTKELIEEKLGRSYIVNFASYNLEKTQYSAPIDINLEGETNAF